MTTAWIDPMTLSPDEREATFQARYAEAQAIAHIGSDSTQNTDHEGGQA